MSRVRSVFGKELKTLQTKHVDTFNANRSRQRVPKAQMNGNRHAEFISASSQPSASIPYWQGPETSSGRQYHSSPADKKLMGGVHD